MKPQVVAISGTSRPDNFTARALAVVQKDLVANGFDVEYFDGRKLSLNFPGQPATADAERLTQAVKQSVAVVLATPEYHGTFSAMTKLILENLGFPSALAGKPVALLGVAAGRIGAIKSLEQLRGTCAHTGAIVIPGAVSIAGVNRVFDDQGHCTDKGSQQALEGLSAALRSFIQQYVCPKWALEQSVREGVEPWVTSV